MAEALKTCTLKTYMQPDRKGPLTYEDAKATRAKIHAIKLNRYELMQVVQNHTGFPWFNGRAYVDFFGWTALAAKAHRSVEELDGVIADLRREGRYDISDRLRAIRDELHQSAFRLMEPEKKEGADG